MDVLLEYFFQVSRARRWQVLAAIVTGAAFAAMTAWGIEPSVRPTVRWAVAGGMIGLLAAIFLLWIDAARRLRSPELRPLRMSEGVRAHVAGFPLSRE